MSNRIAPMRLERHVFLDRIRQTRVTPVIPDDAREAAQTLEQSVRLGKLPHGSDVRERSDTEQQVVIARPMHLVRDRKIIATPVGQAESAHSALHDGADVAALLSQLTPPAARLHTVPDLEYLRWRYADVGGYRAVRELHDGRLTGLAVFRVRVRVRDRGRGRARVTNVCELFVREGDHRSARRLLNRVASATAVDFVVCHFPPHSTARRAAVRGGFIRAPFGLLPTVRRLKDGVVPDPVEHEAWALTLGDFDQL